MAIIKEIDYGDKAVCFKLICTDLNCQNGADAFDEIKSRLIHSKTSSALTISECIIDVSDLLKADPLALSMLSAVKNICIKLKINFFVSGLSEEMNQEMIRHSSFKGKHQQAIPLAHHSMHDKITHLGDMSVDFGKHFMSAVGYIGEFTSSLAYAIRHPFKIRWRETLYYIDVCGADALPIVSMICFLMGLILAFQGAVQLAKVGTDIYLADGVGLSIVKELGPLMVAMISTGRAGSAFAAEIGTMKVGEEISAMTTFGFIPSRFLFVPKFLAMIISLPILTLFGDFVGILGGMVVGYYKLGIPIVAYTNRTLAVISLTNITESLSKSVAFAIIITIVGCMRGFESSSDAQGVGKSATSAVVTSIFIIIIADSFLTYIFTQMPG